MKNVLIPVDFSKDTAEFVKKGIALFSDLETINFLYVVSLSIKELQEYVNSESVSLAKSVAEKKMTEFIKELNLNKKYKVEYAISDGDPARVIIDLANNGKFDAIIIGHRGYSYIEDFFIGSVTLKVISKVNIPVIVIKK
ncbi:MAG: universal stress protein [Conexivisphaerales archaeon]